MSEESAYKLYIVTGSIGTLMVTFFIGILVYFLVDSAYGSWKESREDRR